MTLNLEKVSNAAARGEIVFSTFPSRRSTVHSRGGIIASTQPLANEAGYKILAQGGNAADAAVAVAAALNLTEPSSTGMGGDMFCLFYDAGKRKVFGLNGSGRAPKSLTPEKVLKEHKNAIRPPFESVHAVTVPGTSAGWVDTVEKFGSGRLSMSQILKPTIDLGRNGFQVSSFSSYMWINAEAHLKRASPNYGEILKEGGKAPRPGEMMFNPSLSDSMETLAKEGKNGVYKGRIAQEIVNACKSVGGEMTLDDLASHDSEVVEPISLQFGDLVLSEIPPNGQGLIALIALGIIREYIALHGIDLVKIGHNSPEYIHLIVESLRLAFADGGYYITDPRKTKVPVEGLLSKEYLVARAKLIGDKALSAVQTGVPPAVSDTVYLSVTDQWGNACSFINSNFAGFGTGIIPKGCGFPLQNRGAGFDLRPNRPNTLVGGTRPYHTIIPAMITTTSGDLWASYGVMGGYMQPQGHLQVFLNLAVFGFDPQEALDAPRVCITPGEIDSGRVTICLEEGITCKDKVAALGHDTVLVTGMDRGGTFGRGQVIRCHKQNGQVTYTAGSDQRGDGAAIPFTA